MTTVTDTDLMNQVRDGQVSALSTLFERHHASLFSFCLRMTGNRAVSEDLVQDVFMRMLKHRTTFRRDTAFMPWMYRIARNATVDHLRRKSRGPEPMAEGAEPPSDDPIAETVVAQDEQTGLLRSALLRLPADKRELLLLSRFELKSYEEIGRVLDCSAATVKVRVHRAIKQLRQVYRELAGEPSS